jgi:uncharacterized membrane protein YwzB
MDVIGQISSAEIGIVATIIAAFLEIYKMIPLLLQRFFKVNIEEEFSKTIPVCAIILGMAIDYFFLAQTDYTAKSILFNGVTCGLTAVGGRNAVNAYKSTADTQK